MLLLNNAPFSRSFGARALARLINSAVGLGVFCLLLAAWQLASEQVGSFILEPPLKVLKRAAQLLAHPSEAALLLTAKRALIAAALSLAIGSVLGISAYIWRSFLLFVRPLISMSLSAVPIVWVVLAIFWFGASDLGVVFVVCVCSFGYTFNATLNALKCLPQGCLDMAKVFKFSLYERVFKLYLPFCLPHLLPAWLIGIANSIKLTIMAELLGTASGIGSRISDARAVLDNESVLAYLLLCVGFVALLEQVIIKNLELVISKDKDV